MKYFISWCLMILSGMAWAGLTTSDIQGFNELPESAKGEIIANIAKLAEQQRAATPTVNTNKRVSIIEEAAAGVNMTPDQLMASPAAYAAVQSVVTQHYRRESIRQVVGVTFMLLSTMAAIWLLYGTVVKKVTHSTIVANGKDRIVRSYEFHQRIGGQVTLLFVGWIILINIGLAIVFA